MAIIELIKQCEVVKIENIKDAIKLYTSDKKYFNIEMVKAHLDDRKIAYSDVTVKQYLFNLKEESVIHDAGRGWYSTIEKPFELDTEPIQSIINNIKSKFPLLTFSVWSTEQVKSFFHHTLAKFVTFVYSDRDYLSSLFDALKGAGYSPYLNPTQHESRKSFTIDERTVVVRPSISEEPVQTHYATIEKILIDLFIESDKLMLMDKSEFDFVFSNIAGQFRINVPRLLRYSKRRKIEEDIKNLLNIPTAL